MAIDSYDKEYTDEVEKDKRFGDNRKEIQKEINEQKHKIESLEEENASLREDIEKYKKEKEELLWVLGKETKLLEKLGSQSNEMKEWRDPDTYDSKSNDWVLVKIRDCVTGQIFDKPVIAELRSDGKWHKDGDAKDVIIDEKDYGCIVVSWKPIV